MSNQINNNININTLNQGEEEMKEFNLNEMNVEIIKSMNKNELIEFATYALTKLNERKEQRSNKKYLVLDILKRGNAISILDISNELNISTKNVSSLLCYLRKDGVTIHTDDKGCKYIV